MLRVLFCAMLAAVLAAGCQSSSGAAGTLSPASAFRMSLGSALLAGEEGAAAAVNEPATTTGQGELGTGEKPPAARAVGENEYLHCASLTLDTGEIIPVRLDYTFLYNPDGVWSVSAGYKIYEEPVRGSGPVERNEFSQHPGYFGAALALGESSANAYRRLNLSYARYWAQNARIYLVTDFGFAFVEGITSSATSQEIGAYHYPWENVPFRFGLAYQRRSSDYAFGVENDWNGFRMVAEYLWVNRVMGTLGFAWDEDDLNQTSTSLVAEVKYYPFDTIYFSVSEQRINTEYEWYNLLQISASYCYGVRYSFDFKVSILDSEFMADSLSTVSFGMTYRY